MAEPEPPSYVPQVEAQAPAEAEAETSPAVVAEQPESEPEAAEPETMTVAAREMEAAPEPEPEAPPPPVEPPVEQPVFTEQYSTPLGRARRYGMSEGELPVEVHEDERRLHNDARRFARLLVSEIKLYNEHRRSAKAATKAISTIACAKTSTARGRCTTSASHHRSRRGTITFTRNW